MTIELENNTTRVKWACRRGMLELDLILQPFVEYNYEQMDEQSRSNFNELLQATDQDLYAWLVLNELPPLSKQQDLVLLIKYLSKKQYSLI